MFGRDVDVKKVVVSCKKTAMSCKKLKTIWRKSLKATKRSSIYSYIVPSKSSDVLLKH